MRAADGDRRASAPTRRCGASPRRSSSRRTRRCRPATTASRADLDRGAPRARCAKRWGSRHEQFMGLGPRRTRTTTAKTFCMTVLALKLSRRANAVSSLHGQVSRAMWTPLFPARARSRCRSATSPTASTCRPGWRRRCGRSTTAISGRTGRERSGEPGCLGAIDERRRRRAVGDASDAEDAAHRVRRAAAPRAQAERRGEPPDVVDAAAARR